MEHLPTIVSTIVPHNAQNYDTVGNYIEGSFGWMIEVSKLSKWQHEALVLVHELVEMILTKNNGVDWKDIDHFDMVGEGTLMDDPGASPLAPYHKEHMVADKIERLLAEELGVDWEEYNKDIDSQEWNK